jgi:recombinational DNA repair protein RecR
MRFESYRAGVEDSQVSELTNRVGSKIISGIIVAASSDAATEESAMFVELGVSKFRVNFPTPADSLHRSKRCAERRSL